MADVQKKLQALSDSYQGLQAGKAFALLTNSLVNLGTELGTAVEARQKLESQQQENSTVKKVGLYAHEVGTRTYRCHDRNLTYSTTMRTSTSRSDQYC
jgi:hypothetical protein